MYEGNIPVRDRDDLVLIKDGGRVTTEFEIWRR